ncbi:Mu-like prophage I protein-like protein [Xanthobacter versatilis]|uniref:Mu-like prophage I protein-like protein n=1 Tax=Xanthobacter autotrophicus (strain ATCC BAA-1158 / Py2) TaxID=78245 RepID=A7INX4_XANP2|nr:Mu-like prophage I protein-like protein [Xanthobacter autotrophicus Py2]
MHRDVILFSAFAAGDIVPEWVHLAPTGTFKGRDGRGPYTLDAQAVLADFAAGDRRPIDENHAIDKAAPEGRPSPARGWIVALEARGDGIWGRVEWTDTGRQLLTDKAYRGISPALRVAAGGRVLGIARASLVNDPNLLLTSLHNRSSDHMDLVKLREALGLAADASEAAILAALGQQKTDLATHQAQTASIAAALGLAAGATGDQVVTELQSRQGDASKLAAVKTGLAAAGIDFDKVSATQIETHLRAGGGGTEVTTLRTTVTELQSQLTTLKNDTAKEKAVAFVDSQIVAGKMIRTLRDHYIERHMREPDAVEKELAALPSLHMAGRRAAPAGTQDGTALTDADREVCELMGLDPKAFAATKKTRMEVL